MELSPLLSFRTSSSLASEDISTAGRDQATFLLINYSFIVGVENHNHPLDISLWKAHYLVWDINSVLELMVRSRHHNI